MRRIGTRWHSLVESGTSKIVSTCFFTFMLSVFEAFLGQLTKARGLSVPLVTVTSLESKDFHPQQWLDSVKRSSSTRFCGPLESHRVSPVNSVRVDPRSGT